jgi:hypothetical protein
MAGMSPVRSVGVGRVSAVKALNQIAHRDVSIVALCSPIPSSPFCPRNSAGIGLRLEDIDLFSTPSLIRKCARGESFLVDWTAASRSWMLISCPSLKPIYDSIIVFWPEFRLCRLEDRKAVCLRRSGRSVRLKVDVQSGWVAFLTNRMR